MESVQSVTPLPFRTQDDAIDLERPVASTQEAKEELKRLQKLLKLQLRSDAQPQVLEGLEKRIEVLCETLGKRYRPIALV